jgi:two-component system, response regulator PdtaR
VTAKRILVVEDEAIITADLRNKVERLGYVVCGTAFSGEDAIQKADDTEPDLVLMDVRLRGNMTGIEAASQIRKRRNVPVIYITAYVGFLPDTEETRDTSLWLSKPFSSSELKKILQSALNRVQS